MADVRSWSLSEGVSFDPELAVSSSTESLESLHSVPPVSPEQSSERDHNPETIQAMERDLRMHLMTVLAEVDSLRADLRDDGLCYQSLELKNLHLQVLFRHLCDQTFSLRVQIEQLLKEVDILKGKRTRRPLHLGDGENVDLAKRSGVTQDTWSDKLDQSHMRMPHEKQEMSTTKFHSSPGHPFSRTDLPSSTHVKADSCNLKRNVQKSNMFFSCLGKVFRRNTP